jgi:hypothetical protein
MTLDIGCLNRQPFRMPFVVAPGPLYWDLRLASRFPGLLIVRHLETRVSCRVVLAVRSFQKVK